MPAVEHSVKVPPKRKRAVMTASMPVTATMMSAGERARLRADILWYERNKERLRKRYPKQHLVIIDKKVVDHGRSLHALTQRVGKKIDVAPVFMPYTGDVDDEVLNLRTGARRVAPR
jgi:hypothetical protein